MVDTNFMISKEQIVMDKIIGGIFLTAMAIVRTIGFVPSICSLLATFAMLPSKIK